MPSSNIKSLVASPKIPNVSTAIGAKMNDGDNDVAYLLRFRSLASFATAANPDEARVKRLRASVSVQGKSHTRYLPSFHGIMVMPLLFLEKDLVSSREGISAASDSFVTVGYFYLLTYLMHVWLYRWLHRVERNDPLNFCSSAHDDQVDQLACHIILCTYIGYFHVGYPLLMKSDKVKRTSYPQTPDHPSSRSLAMRASPSICEKELPTGVTQFVMNWFSQASSEMWVALEYNVL